MFFKVLVGAKQLISPSRVLLRQVHQTSRPVIQRKFDIMDKIVLAQEALNGGNHSKYRNLVNECNSEYRKYFPDIFKPTDPSIEFPKLSPQRQWKFICAYNFSRYSMIWRFSGVKVSERDARDCAKNVYNWAYKDQRNIKRGLSLAAKLYRHTKQ